MWLLIAKKEKKIGLVRMQFWLGKKIKDQLHLWDTLISCLAAWDRHTMTAIPILPKYLLLENISDTLIQHFRVIFVTGKPHIVLQDYGKSCLANC